jgi:hypothetical protein
MAVGRYSDPADNLESFSETWNGTRWTIQPASGTQLSSVWCAGPNFCVATGALFTNDTALDQIWNGKSWRLLTWVSRHKVYYAGADLGVSCVGQTFCMLVGYSAAEWNDGSWSNHSMPGLIGPCYVEFCPAIFLGVSCVSKTFCVRQHGPVHGRRQ